jgi:NADPH:quinone reductase-like Zn-dependent oxidoreductase
MKAIVASKYGPPEVMKLQDVEKPVIKPDELLIRIHATTVSAGDCELRRFEMPILFWLPLRIFMGIRRPKYILGTEVAGVVELVGDQGSRFQVGDPVTAFTGFRFGAYAEYVSLPVDGMIIKKPGNMSFEEAASIHIGGLNALGFLRKAGIKKGDHILIYGASGSIGTFAVQIARTLGAEVTAVCSQKHHEVIRSIGADHIIDYKKVDYALHDKRYDCVFDAVGKDGLFHGLKVLKQKGVYIQASPKFLHTILAPWVSVFAKKKVLLNPPGEQVSDLQELKGLIEAGELRSVMDRSYPLDKMVEAHRYVEEGHKQGNVGIGVR